MITSILDENNEVLVTLEVSDKVTKVAYKYLLDLIDERIIELEDRE